MTVTPLTMPTSDWLAWLQQIGESQLDRARRAIADLKANPPAGALGVLEAMNDIEIVLSNVAHRGYLFSEVLPEAAARQAAEEFALAARRLITDLGLDTELYRILAGLDGSGLDPAAARLLEHLLRDFRRAGVAASQADRQRIKRVHDRLTVLGQAFARNIREGTKTVRFAPGQLAGLPSDWLAAHPAAADGLIDVTTDYPDLIPVRNFARDAETRRAVLVASLTRALPENVEVLHEMLALRAELAGLLGYANWPDYEAETRMIGTGAAIGEFIDKIAGPAEASARRDVAILLARLQQDRPEATQVEGYDVAYYTEAHRREQLAVDAQLVRTYFDFAKVRAGVLAVTGRLFGLTYTQVEVPVWHPDVLAYDVARSDDGAAVGRIYLDLHPRAGKFKHAAQFTLTTGVAGRQLPEGVLVCNFPTGLMEHDQVITLFHEFGHLIHELIGGQQHWVRFSGVATEWDFVEAPSQMLEEWAWDVGVLQSFATNAAGEPIPAELVARMRQADDFGKGFQLRTQLFYAALAYRLHLDDPGDLAEYTQRIQRRYSMFPYLAGTCMPASFGHLEGYGSAYYTYTWSLVIAKDLFSAFDSGDLLDPEIAARYRDRVLAPGGSRDAADLVADFLGRPYTFDSYLAWLAR